MDPTHSLFIRWFSQISLYILEIMVVFGALVVGIGLFFCWYFVKKYSYFDAHLRWVVVRGHLILNLANLGFVLFSTFRVIWFEHMVTTYDAEWHEIARNGNVFQSFRWFFFGFFVIFFCQFFWEIIRIYQYYITVAYHLPAIQDFVGLDCCVLLLLWLLTVTYLSFAHYQLELGDFRIHFCEIWMVCCLVLFRILLIICDHPANANGYFWYVRPRKDWQHNRMRYIMIKIDKIENHLREYLLEDIIHIIFDFCGDMGVQLHQLYFNQVAPAPSVVLRGNSYNLMLHR